MRIYYGDHQEPLILDTARCLDQIKKRITAFIRSPESECIIPANSLPKEWPGLQELLGIRLLKGNGQLLVSVSTKGYLDVTGSTENLSLFADLFEFEPSAHDGDHHHIEVIVLRGGDISPKTCSPIIEIYDKGET
jgi:hypothetical protein